MLPQTQQFRNGQANLRRLAEQQLEALWPLLDPQKLDDTFPGWFVQVGKIVRGHRAVSATLAARYLRGLGVKVQLAKPVPADVLLSSLEVTSKISVKQAMTAGTPLDVAVQTALAASTAAAVRHILEGGNETARASAIADPKVTSWRRVVSPGACDYCRSRDGLYQATAEFNCHDGCNCSVEPVTE